MKKLNICRFIFIINLLILPFFILFNMKLNNNIKVVKEEKNIAKQTFQNSRKIETIDCAYILENLGKDEYVNIKNIQSEKNNIYVNLNYCGDDEKLKGFLKNINSSKNFKSMKSLIINTNDAKNNNIKDNNEKVNNYKNSNNEEKQVDITLEYIKNIK